VRGDSRSECPGAANEAERATGRQAVQMKACVRSAHAQAAGARRWQCAGVRGNVRRACVMARPPVRKVEILHHCVAGVETAGLGTGR